MSEKPRRWFQIHLSTALLATLGAGAFLGLNFWPAKARCESIGDFFDDVVEDQRVGPANGSEKFLDLVLNVRKAWQLDTLNLESRDVSFDVYSYFQRLESGWPWRAIVHGGAFDGARKIEYLSDTNGVGNHCVIITNQQGSTVILNVTDNYTYEKTTGSLNYINSFNLKHGTRIASWQNLLGNAAFCLSIIAVLVIDCEIAIRRREACQP